MLALFVRCILFHLSRSFPIHNDIEFAIWETLSIDIDYF